jgi:hypothetical protein
MVQTQRQPISATQPTAIGSLHRRSGSILRPRRQLTAIGMAYERSRAITADEMMALNALRQLVRVSASGWDSGWHIRRRAEEDEPEANHNHRREHQRVQRKTELGVHPGEESRRGKAAVSAGVSSARAVEQRCIPGKRKDHPAARRHDADCCKDQTHQRQPVR